MSENKHSQLLKTDGNLPSGSSEHDLLTVQEVAEILKVPVSWVYERTRRRGADRMPGFRLGKYWRFREADVFAWLERQRARKYTDA
jgi:excisionase family DNA binding protein